MYGPTYPFVYRRSLPLQESNGKWYVDVFKKSLATGKVKPIPVFIQPNGIAGVKDGLQYMKDGKVRSTNVYVSIGQMRIDG
jgi:hypothetical protein